MNLLTEHLAIWTGADNEKKSGRGRASGSAARVYGVKKLRELILELAVRGKLVPQEASDEPASELLKRIAAEKAKLIEEGKIKKDKPLATIGDDEKPFELPMGWEWVRLGGVIDYVNGFAFSSKDFSTHGVGVVKIGDIQAGEVNIQSMSRVSMSVVANLDERLKVELGDLVIAMSGATTGKLGFNNTGEVFYLNQRVGKIVPFLISSKFLCIDLTTKISENLEKSFGSAIPNLSTEQINAIVMAIPPLAEQHRIVAKVDELMTLCDQLENQHSNAIVAHEKLVSYLLNTLTQTPVRPELVEGLYGSTSSPRAELVGSPRTDDFAESWQRIAANFDTLFSTESSVDALKQTVLQLAVMGKLVPQDVNDEPTSELLKRIQAEKAKLIAEGKIKKDKQRLTVVDDGKNYLPVSWVSIYVQDFADVRLGSTPSRSQSEYWDGSIPWVSSGEVANKVIYETTEKITERGFKNSSVCLIPKRSLLIAIIGQGKTRGQSALLGIDACTNQNVAALVFNEVYISPEFVWIWARSKYESHRDDGRGGAQPALNGNIVKGFKFNLPPLAEQHRIVAKVDELMAICDQLKTRITTANQLQQKLADVLVEQAIN